MSSHIVGLRLGSAATGQRSSSVFSPPVSSNRTDPNNSQCLSYIDSTSTLWTAKSKKNLSNPSTNCGNVLRL
ncbi:hypothetical protein RSOLAG1IB_03684 [Rhizoctonia solani AG-1 IB]|uniref:Uncharacterized protein n=1 Tax=Thanatephorus cucumeris (strain AG1-IB / isolate 7/3/14) TaxID=1108050 RepID=A0A0B7FP62_THACB|nr:hypothetical protein RSOLAG1IB_03684 [Rhizoctonia solani AG-1 IB]